MLVVLSDTHGTDDPRLSAGTREAVAAADRVVHAGDLTTERVLDALYDLADRLDAVAGNADESAVRDRLPTARVLDYRWVRVVVTHRQSGGATGLSLFGRERGADVVVSGHTHRPSIREGPPTLVNPGSHADPRGGRPTYAVFRPVEEKHPNDGSVGALAIEIHDARDPPDDEAIDGARIER